MGGMKSQTPKPTPRVQRVQPEPTPSQAVASDRAKKAAMSSRQSTLLDQSVTGSDKLG